MTGPDQQPNSTQQGLEALVELERALHKAKTPRDAGTALMRATKALFHWDAAYLYLYSPDNNQLHPVIAYDNADGNGDEEVQFLMRAPAKGSYTEKAISAGPFLVQQDHSKGMVNPALSYGNRQKMSASMIFSPIPGTHGPIGILSVQSYTPGKFDESDLDLIKIIAGYCSRVFESKFSLLEKREADDRFAKVLFFAPIGLGLVAPDGQWLKVNPAFCKMLQCAREDIIATHMQDMLIPSDAARFDALIAQMVSDEKMETAELEVQMVRHNKSRLRVAISVHAMRDQLNAPVHFVLHFQDVTGARRHNQVQKVFRSLGQKLLGAVTPSEVSFHMLEAADELFEWGCAFVDLYSEKTQRYEAIMTVDVFEGKRVTIPPRHKEIVPGSNTERALKEGAFMVLRTPEETASPGQIVPFRNNRPSASLMYVPMRRGNHNVGVISIQSYEHHVYTEEDLQLLQELADFCSTSFEQTYAESKAAQAEASLLESQKRFKMVMRATNDAVYD